MAFNFNVLPMASNIDLGVLSPIITSLAIFDLSPLKKTSNLPLSKLATFKTYLAKELSLVENYRTIILPYFW